MRGRTLDDAFIILDEAQNTTPEQMKMFLTRMGFGSKVVVTGDITQIDLPEGTRSGLVDVQRVLRNVPGISFYYLTERDVVRNDLVQLIIKAYEAAGGGGTGSHPPGRGPVSRTGRSLRVKMGGKGTVKPDPPKSDLCVYGSSFVNGSRT